MEQTRDRVDGSALSRGLLTIMDTTLLTALAALSDQTCAEYLLPAMRMLTSTDRSAFGVTHRKVQRGLMTPPRRSRGSGRLSRRCGNGGAGIEGLPAACIA